MGLPEFKREIGEVENMIADGPTVSAPSLAVSKDILSQIDAYIENFDDSMRRWIASIHPAILRVRQLVERAAAEGHDELTAVTVETATTRLNVAIENSIRMLEGSAPLKARIERALQQHSATFIANRAQALKLKTKVDDVFTRLLAAVYDLRDQVKLIEYDFHPDCRGSGEVISTQAGLDAFFDRLS